MTSKLPVSVVLLGALLLESSCCLRWEEARKQEPVVMKVSPRVEVPLRLEVLRGLHAPPDVVVTVENRKSIAGGPACAHTPLCLFVLPFIVMDYAFGESVNEATVTRGGERSLNALYDEQGLLLGASEVKSGGTRVVRRIHLPELGYEAFVESGFMKDVPDGPSDFVATPLLSQLPLADDYRKRLESVNPSVRGALLLEAFLHVGGELDELVLDGLRGPSLDDGARRGAIEGVCANSQREHDRRDRFIEAALSRSAPRASLAALACELLPEQLAVRAAADSLSAYCRGPTGIDLRNAVWGYEQVKHLDLGRLPTDCAPERAMLLRRVRGALVPGDDELMARALVSDVYQAAAEANLDTENPVHRGWVLAAMRRDRTKELLRWFEEAPEPPSVAEFEPLLRISSEQPEGWDGNGMRVRIVTLLSRTKTERATAGLRQLAKGELRAQALLALAARGDAGGRRVLMAALPRGQSVPRTGMMLSGTHELMAYVLTLGGCERKALERALEQEPRGAVDAACGG